MATYPCTIGEISPDIPTVAAGLGGTPAVVLGSSVAAGSAATFLRTDDTIAAFDATVPAALAATAAVGSAAFAARRDHVHLFPTSLRSTANAKTVTLTDNGTDETLQGEFGNLLVAGWATAGAQRGVTMTLRSQGGFPACVYTLRDTNGTQVGVFNAGALAVFGATEDVFFQGIPQAATGYMVYEGFGGSGTVLGSNNTNPVLISVNRTNVGTTASIVAKFNTSTLDLSNTDPYDIVLGSTTGTKIGTATTQKLGFWNKTPTTQPAAYTPTNVTTDRSYDANSTTVAELADVLGTLITDLQSIGLIG